MMQYSQLAESASAVSSANSASNEEPESSSRSKKKSRKGGGKKTTKSELSEPLTGEGGDDRGGDEHRENHWDDNTGVDPELGLQRGGAVSAPAMEDDPFYVFREDLLQKIDLCQSASERYLHVIRTTDTAANSHEVKDLKKQLKRHIKNAESTLKDLQTTVRVVESAREKFPHIDDSELYSRRSLVQASHDRISATKKGMNCDEVKTKMLEDERAMALRRAGGDMGARTDAEHENTAFIADSQANASLMLAKQDETLDELDEAVQRVGTMAGNINEELGQQNKMLTELDEDLADAEEKLGLVMGKLAKLLKTKNKCQLGTILGLILTVIVLFFLVIYT